MIHFSRSPRGKATCQGVGKEDGFIGPTLKKKKKATIKDVFQR